MLGYLIQGIKEVPVQDIIRGFGHSFLDGGVALYFMSLGGMLLHSVFGALDVVWDAIVETVSSKMMPVKLS